VSVYIKVAETEKELKQAFEVRLEVFGKELGYLDAADYPEGLEHDVYDDHPEITSSFIALVDGRGVGTLRLVRDSRLGFNLEEHVVLNGLRSGNRALAEASRYAVLKEYRGNPDIARGLLKIAFNQGISRGLTDYVISANDGTKKGRSAVPIFTALGFVPLGEHFDYEEFNEYALPMRLELKSPSASFRRYLEMTHSFIQQPYQSLGSALGLEDKIRKAI